MRASGRSLLASAEARAASKAESRGSRTIPCTRKRRRLVTYPAPFKTRVGCSDLERCRICRPRWLERSIADARAGRLEGDEKLVQQTGRGL